VDVSAETTVEAPRGTGRAVPKRPSWVHRTLLTRRGARITAPLLFLLAWQVIAPAMESRILPVPADVAEEMWDLLVAGTVVEAFSISLGRLALGFALALVVGSVIGLAMGMSPRIEALLHDFVVVGLTFPYLIWGLLVAIWFGFEGQGPIIVVFIAGLPYVIINASEGVRDVSKELRDMASAYDVPNARVVRHLVLPSLMPFFFASLRYGLANGWKGLVLAEVFASDAGAGYQIAEFRDYGNFEGVVGFAIYFAAFSILVERLVFGRLSRRVFRWRPASAQPIQEVTETG
jgi:ABC-type nitrate/sulfonate/bicarbonate transport system permease component